MKVALIGRVANDISLYDGQTVKTRNLLKLISSIEEVEGVYIVDTYKYSKRFIFVFVEMLKALKNCDAVILSVSINGRKVFFPLLYALNKIYKKRIYHSLIGGRLAQNVKDHPKWKQYINSFEKNWVESKTIVDDLKKIGVYNGEYLPNFKNIPILSENDMRIDTTEFKFCTFSRVQKMKGIEDAIVAIGGIIKKYNYSVSLDIYGPIDKEYEFEFREILSQFPQQVRYMGCVDSNMSVETIKDYYALIFPTRYYNEGIPGTIIDALSSGVPVIARKWHYCAEMLEDGVTGYIYDFDKPEMLEMKIIDAIHNDDFLSMKKNCLARAKEYSFENAKNIIESDLF